MIKRFVQGEYQAKYKATIGASFASKEIFVEDKAVLVQVWDTAGQERYRSIGAMFYRGSDFCLLVCDITDLESLNSLERWKADFLSQVDPLDRDGFPFVVLANKVDKYTDSKERKAAVEQVKNWCNKHNKIPFYETSAKNGLNVAEAFNAAAELALRNKESNKPLNNELPRGKIIVRRAKSFPVAKHQCC